MSKEVRADLAPLMSDDDLRLERFFERRSKLDEKSRKSRTCYVKES